MDLAAAAARCWRIASGRYVATFGFVDPDQPFAGALTCRSLTRDGDELLVGPGAPLVLPWMGRLASMRFEVAGTIADLADAEGVTLDDDGRPLHGLPLDPRSWEVVDGDATGGRPPDTFVAEADVDLGSGFPAPHRVRVEARCGAEGLVVTTWVESTGGGGVPVALGWHPYLRAPGTGASGTGVEVYLPFTVACELDALLPTGVEHAAAPLWLRDPVVDHHWRTSPGDEAVVCSEGLEVRLVVGRGYGWAMTWVPAVGAGFVCVEPMAGPLDPFRPGAETTHALPGRPWVGAYAIG